MFRRWILLQDVDVESFRILNEWYARDKDSIYFEGKIVAENEEYLCR